MTNVQHTVSDILQIMADLRGESTVSTEAKRIRAISRANQDFSKRDYWVTHQLIEQTITGDGSNSYTIGSASYPMRKKGLVEVYVGGTAESQRYSLVDRQVFNNLYNRNNNARIAYEWYDAANDQWKVRINPTVDSDTIYYSYFFEPADVTATSDTVVCENPYILAYLALAIIHEGEDENQEALLDKRNAEVLISDCSKVEDMPAINQLYAMGAIENSISNHGIGTY